jgi:hypothetical protein
MVPACPGWVEQSSNLLFFLTLKLFNPKSKGVGINLLIERMGST